MAKAKLTRDQERKKAAQERKKAAAQKPLPFAFPPPPDRNRMAPKELAQELVWDAMDASPAEQKRLLAQALALDPTNLEARRMTLMEMDLPAEQKLPLLAELVAGFAAELGEAFFKEHAGHFWGLVETRPYMRARFDLAEAYKAAGRPAEAKAEFAAMFELCPNDNLGLRYQLASLHLILGETQKCRELLLKYEEEKDYAAAFAWAWPLERFLAGDAAAAEHELTLARKQNRFVAPYLLGKRLPSKNLPDMYSPGDEAEAILFSPLLKQAWSTQPAAFAWLETHLKPART